MGSAASVFVAARFWPTTCLALPWSAPLIMVRVYQIIAPRSVLRWLDTSDTNLEELTMRRAMIAVAALAAGSILTAAGLAAAGDDKATHKQAMADSLAALENRIAELEDKVTALGGGTAGVIRAREFHAVDAKGKVLGRFGVWLDGTVGLLLANKDGNTRGLFSLLPDGAVAVGLCDKDENPRGSFCLYPDGGVILGLIDKGGKNRGMFSLSPADRVDLWLADKDGNFRGMFSLTPDGTVALKLADKDGKGRGQFSLTSAGRVDLFLRDKDGKVIFNAP